MIIPVIGFVALLGLIAAAAPEPWRQPMVPDWQKRVVMRVVAHESAAAGAYSATNRNLDGAGLSWGLLQWAQQPGSLGVLLHRMRSQHPTLFDRVFVRGPELVAHTVAKRLGPLDGAVLWEEPWLGRFRAAAASPEFQAAQLEEALTGEHWRGVGPVVAALGVATERAYTVAFDACVQQGPPAALRAAQRAHGMKAPSESILMAYARACAAPYRRLEEPTGPHPSAPRIVWRQVGVEWHAFAGRWDLYVDILRRRTAIVRDPSVSDVGVA